MSASIRAASAPSSSRPEPVLDTRAELNSAESRNMQLPSFNNQLVPDELLVSLTSTVCTRSTLGHTAHHRHCKGCGIRRPDAVWHHPLGRKKYRHFLEQPTSLTGAGRDISFLCDAMVTQRKTTPLPPLTDRNSTGDTQNLSISDSLIPEEYHIVKNKGLRGLEFYEDAFTVQLQDDEHKLRVFPSLRPSGRLEVVQLMRMMDDMLEKAGVDQQSEQLTQLSQMEGLLELVQVEQNIYNIVFHEVIRQVSVGCAERGQLLAKLRQRYQSLLERMPRCLKALHTEAVAQRALDRRLTEEIHHIKTSIQQLSTELFKIRDHDASVSQQVEFTHRQLAEELDQSHTNSGVVQGYHELYELQRGRLEAQMLQTTEERDSWSQLTFRFALKVISVKKLELVRRLHVHEQSWFKTAEHCILYLTSKDTEDMNIIMELSDNWKEQLMAFVSQMKKSEHAQFEEMNAIQQDITKWISFCTAQNQCPDPKYENVTLEKIHVDLKQWSTILAQQCERYQGEELFCCQQILGELGCVQERWLNMSAQLLRRHSSPDGAPPVGEEALSELVRVLPELLKRLDTQASGETGVHGKIMSLLGDMDSWVSKLDAAIRQPETISVSDWLKLEQALCIWQSLAEEALKNETREGKGNESVQDEPNIYKETEELLEKVKEFINSLSNFTDGENQGLSEEVSSLHMAQTRWMLDLLLLMVPDHREDQDQDQDQVHEQQHQYITNISPQTLDEDAKFLTQKLDYFSKYISSFYKLILEEKTFAHQAEDENEMNNWCRKLQRECVDWVQTCVILLSGVKGGQVELPVKQSATSSRSDVSASPADSGETVRNKEVSAEHTTYSEVTEVKDETEVEPRESTTDEHKIQQDVCEGELTVCETPVVKLIGYDGNITQRKLGENIVHLREIDELVVCPATDKAQKAFSDLTTVGLLQQELHDSELRVQSSEQRALKAEEALQAALEKIQDLERQLQGRPSLEPKSIEEKKKTPPPSPPPEKLPAPLKKTAPEAKPTSTTRRTKKR
ncbi:axonemal dynein light chain domain-containing protein 1 [Hippoglossus stenolepis]|uniref:axonemal dynein light chain domain-containing protein 1 n=1 Tax=Hippoglossus stenolepis TaxID=195615 RepID=UPI001FAFAB8E|nr:axonemal dynein light chain domain-containing protein 1 [Hippoglossus stenolepis]